MYPRMQCSRSRIVLNIAEARAFRISISIVFGLFGFWVNFLDIALVEGPTFEISILGGLLFPLIITLAWGWPYGIVSALAGGCQSMWWLWSFDGWGLFYAVPVFTLWIVWHGWWSQQRREGHQNIHQPTQKLFDPAAEIGGG